ncbi:MAG: hypothetical protein EBT91_03290 [Rhodobacteraceae bacterium]|nr:hypothetical protein [Paracoccaceae bacterium]
MPTQADNRFLHYAPRVIGILGILFLSSFALDVFGQGYSASDLVVALFMHLIPSLVLIAVLTLAWTYERLGGALFIAAAIGPWAVFPDNDLIANLIISGPFFIVGLLFWISGSRKAR